MSNVHFEWHGEKVSDDVKSIVNRALKECGEDLRAESNKKIPILTGIMQSTGDVSQDEETMVVNVSYDTPYVVRQHEDTRLRHRDKRTSKFLENALNRFRDKYIKWISKSISEYMKS